MPVGPIKSSRKLSGSILLTLRKRKRNYLPSKSFRVLSFPAALARGG